MNHLAFALQHLNYPWIAAFSFPQPWLSQSFPERLADVVSPIRGCLNCWGRVGCCFVANGHNCDVVVRWSAKPSMTERSLLSRAP